MTVIPEALTDLLLAASVRRSRRLFLLNHRSAEVKTILVPFGRPKRNAVRQSDREKEKGGRVSKEKIRSTREPLEGVCR